METIVGDRAITGSKKALMIAIAIEQHNAKWFRQWSHRFRSYDTDTCKFLEGLQQEELQHEQELKEEYLKYFGEEVPEYISLPEELKQYVLELESIKKHFFVVNSDMALTLLQMALQVEQYTRQFYLDLQAETEDEALSNVYKKLGEYEAEHEQLFHDRIATEQSKKNVPNESKL